ncbi:hypothetical protein EK21DRAFT_118015 [Setomelanomma holmii]|uniref:Uncharacterized protein n=1 Tax=Setomelanomma holmii TaxID=210430 RepID=A0A9P4LGH7_9PLEO|nr:hypothetical protein EK21DRAFT_118015 [Setomelanomma holmii]
MTADEEMHKLDREYLEKLEEDKSCKRTRKFEFEEGEDNSEFDGGDKDQGDCGVAITVHLDKDGVQYKNKYFSTCGGSFLNVDMFEAYLKRLLKYERKLLERGLTEIRDYPTHNWELKYGPAFQYVIVLCEGLDPSISYVEAWARKQSCEQQEPSRDQNVPSQSEKQTLLKLQSLWMLQPARSRLRY